MDGLFRAALTAPQDYFQIDGGRPIYVDGPIVLCDRADHLPGRTFDGKIAQLSIFDAALTENNVRPSHSPLAHGRSCAGDCARAEVFGGLLDPLGMPGVQIQGCHIRQPGSGSFKAALVPTAFAISSSFQPALCEARFAGGCWHVSAQRGREGSGQAVSTLVMYHSSRSQAREVTKH